MYGKLNNISHNKKNSDAFTVAEVVVASAILLIAMVPILKALTYANMNTVSIENKTTSLVLAQYKLDEVKARAIYNYTSSFAESNTALDGQYLCNVDDTAVNADLRTITVSVGFDHDTDTNLDSDEIEVTLATLVAKRW